MRGRCWSVATPLGSPISTRSPRHVAEPRFVLDLSAWARSGHAAAKDRWRELVADDRLVCHPVFAIELLHNAINPEDYQRIRNDLDEAFDWVMPDEETAALAVRLQQRMATSVACGQRVKTPDILIAALAVQHRMGVLHCDGDYDVIRQRSGEVFESEWLAAPRILDVGAELANSRRRGYRKAFGERMIQFNDDSDLEIWPALIDWMDAQLRDAGRPAPPAPDG